MPAHLINHRHPPALPQENVMGRNKTEELCLGLASCRSAMAMAIEGQVFGPSTVLPIGRVILLMCADSTWLLIDITMWLNLPGNIITH